MLCIDAHRINSVYQKLEMHGNIAYLLENKIIMIIIIMIFVRKMISKSGRCCNVNTRSESRRRKHNVVTTLVFGRSSDVGKTTWQRCDNVIWRRDQKATKSQRCYNVVCQLGNKDNFRGLDWLKQSIFLYQTHKHVSKVKTTITRYAYCFVPGISTSKNLFKEIESVNSNALGRSSSFEQMLVGWDEIYW